MESSRVSTRVLALGVVIVGAALFRLLPAPPNFSPIAALALFAGYSFQDRALGFVTPLLALLVSDAILGFHDLMWATYLGFAMIVGLGRFLRGMKGAGSKALGAACGTLVFFALTNFAVWLQSGMYEKTAAGLAACYVAALPFLDNALAGDLIFTAALFGGWAFAERRLPGLREQTVS